MSTRIFDSGKRPTRKELRLGKTLPSTLGANYAVQSRKDRSCDIVFQPRDTFKSMELTSTDIKFTDPDSNSNFRLAGKSVKVELVEQMNHFSQVTISKRYQDPSDGLGSLRTYLSIELLLLVSMTLKCFKFIGNINMNLLLILLDHFKTLSELREIDINAKLLDGNFQVMNVPLPPLCQSNFPPIFLTHSYLSDVE